MSCTYNYKGKEFENEHQLNDFLLEKEKYYSKYGDIVFQRSPVFLRVKDQVETLSKESKELRDKLRAGVQKYMDGEAYYDPNPPYVGVNAFLSGLVNSDGKLLFPEFRDKEYWDKRKLQWKEAKFTDEEKELFFNSDTNIQPIQESDAQKYIDIIKDKWKNQAEMGEAVHSVLQLYFSKIKSGANTGKIMGTMSDDFLLNVYFPKQLDMSLISKTAIKDSLKIARQLHNQLESKFGKDCEYYPEFTLMGETAQEVPGKGNKVLGRIDLLVVDQKGNTHVVDYKTSPKSFYGRGVGENGYSEAKKLTYTYQIAVYNRILERYGIDVGQSDMLVVPLQLTNFRKDGDKWTYDHVKPIQEEAVDANGNVTSPAILWHSIKTTVESNFNIQRNLDEFFPYKLNQSVDSEHLQEATTKFMNDNFKNYSSTEVEATDAEILEDFKEQDSLTPKNGMLIYRIGNHEIMVTEKQGEAELLKKVKAYNHLCATFRVKVTTNIINSLKSAIKNEDPNMQLPQISNGQVGVSTQWLNNLLYKYCNSNWKVIDNKALEQYGIIVLQNQSTGQIDVKRVTNREPLYLRHFGKSDRNYLTGEHIPDQTELSNSSSLMLKSIQGNVELIETMFILNNLKGLLTKGTTLGSIEVLNPYKGKGLTASNEELLYSFKRLSQLSGYDNINLFKEKNVCSKYQLTLNEFHDIMSLGKNREWAGDYSPFKTYEPCLSDMDLMASENIDSKIKALESLIKNMENTNEWSKSLKTFEHSQEHLISNYRALYNSAQIALADLRGITFKQQSQHTKDWLSSTRVLTQGISGARIDNPGNLESETLNLITKQTTQAYQNVRDELRQPAEKLRELTQALIKRKGFKLSGNITSYFSNLYEDPNKTGGDFRFKKLSDPTLFKEERDILQYALRLINKNRFNLTDSECEAQEKEGKVEYYRVPLMVGKIDSMITTDSLLSTLKNKLKGLSPKRILENLNSRIKGIGYLEDNDETTKANTDLFELGTIFDRGESIDRQDIINRTVAKNGSLGYFEHNLENLALSHYFAYSMKNNINKVFPIMKAAVAHIAYQGMMVNQEFNEDINYIQDYIRNKIKNESLIPKNYRIMSEYINKLKQGASFMVLAFNPVQALYQSIQGIWNDIRLIIQRPDMISKHGDTAFTWKNMSESFAETYKDLFAFGDKKTTSSLLNELYGLNDMDINQYVERIKTQQRGIFNFNKFAFTFSSRPDFYNRLTIFGAQMRHDGSWDAHKVINGKLKYDWTKDKRFDKFANEDKSDLELYQQQRALYYEMCKQFVNEHTKYEDGTEFTYTVGEKVKLPRAYTNQQAESYKSLSDDIYGYYSHEKKSLIHASLIGSLFMQFKTFWTGKKNQYFGKGGVKLRGQYVHIKNDNGELLYYQLNDNNEVTDEIGTTNTGFPVVKWEGQWQEGIVLTLSNMLNKNPAEWKQSFLDQWYNPNLNLRNAYRSNYKQLGYDLLLWIIIGNLVAAGLAGWLKDLKEDSKIDPQPLKLSAANIAVKSINNSFLDFNVWDSFGSPVTNWSPFSFEWFGKTAKSAYNTAFGDKDMWDFMWNFTSAGRAIKPGMDLIKPKDEE